MAFDFSMQMPRNEEFDRISKDENIEENIWPNTFE